METKYCPQCKAIALSSFYFCPNCGKKLRDKPMSTSVATQIGVYLLSFFLPPFGLIPALRYMRQTDRKSKIIGVVAIVLTAISLVVSVYYAIIFINQFNQTLTSQLNLQGY